LSLLIAEILHNAEPPAFEVLPTLKALKERVIAASRGRYRAVFMSGRYVLGLYFSMATAHMQFISKRASQRRHLPFMFLLPPSLERPSLPYSQPVYFSSVPLGYCDYFKLAV
jgi:hypothetical protein